MEKIKVNITPRPVSQVCHASQGDVGRVIRCDLYDDAEVFTLAGTEALRLRYKKPDGGIGSASVVNTSDSYVEITLPADALTLAGSVYCKLKIDSIAARSFIVEVEKKP